MLDDIKMNKIMLLKLNAEFDGAHAKMNQETLSKLESLRNYDLKSIIKEIDKNYISSCYVDVEAVCFIVYLEKFEG